MSTLRPQRLTDAHAEVLSVEWLVEPFWPGNRLLAHLTDGIVTLTDVDGDPVARPDLESLLASGVTAGTAVLDGVLTTMPLDGSDDSDGAFIAIDLLELDGQSLLDVPFQERRRLLASVVEPGPRLTVSPAVKVPLEGWLAAWRQSGFSHYVARHMNSRYLPAEQNDDCLRIELGTAIAAPPMLWRLTGTRDRIRRIRD